MFDVKGKTAIVTGGSSGFGLVLCQRLARKGANVVIADVNVAAGEKLAAELCEKHGKVAIFVKTDVSKREDCIGMFEAAKKAFQTPIQVVVNNAGLAESPINYIEDVEDSYRKMVEVNIWGVLYGTRLALTEMVKHGKGGAIVNTASLAGLYPQQWSPVYSLTKSGVVMLGRSLEHLSREHNIRVNTVCPSNSPTPLFLDALSRSKDKHGQAHYDWMMKAVVPIDTVVDAFERAIEDESLAGEALRATPQNGVDLMKWKTNRAGIKL
ncbi:hypothetical protein DFJ74DRAFT_671340 [Hyaloraphidium curvatum]|nr:hypothetical protein DFJ74DRAFT_671340 [Hyaloraphidium curvatum]